MELTTFQATPTTVTKLIPTKSSRFHSPANVVTEQVNSYFSLIPNKLTINILTFTVSTGTSNHVPRYKIVPGDGLDAIARFRFAGLVKYQQIQTANKIPDANNITAGATIWIPLPCSCDQVDGSSVMHYAHIVPMGSSIQSIAQQYATRQQTLLSLNDLDDPKNLLAGQLLDVPLPG